MDGTILKMTGSLSVTLAHKWDEEKVDPTGWLISEKLDGVRSVWTGAQLISRNGKPFSPPDYFTEDFPTNVVLDGEIFGGRGKFQMTVGIVKNCASRKDEWKNLAFMVFDAPHVVGSFEERYKYLLTLVTGDCSKYLKVVPHFECLNKDHLLFELSHITERGGEGLMIRRKESAYETGRSHTLLKVKTSLDLDAKVIGHTIGKGRNCGVLGALICALIDDGGAKTFSVGTGFTDEQRKSPPAIGTIIVVKYQELTASGVPRFPVYIGDRADDTAPSC